MAAVQNKHVSTTVPSETYRFLLNKKVNSDKTLQVIIRELLNEACEREKGKAKHEQEQEVGAEKREEYQFP